MPATPLTGQNIIDNFEPYTGDTTELSSSAELDLLDKIYRKVLNDRPWEFLKKAATGTVSVTNGVATISVPSDFAYLHTNSFATDPEIGASANAQDNGAGRVIFLQTTTGVFQKYTVVNFSDRRQYYNRAGYAYLDVANSLITFTQLPTFSDLSYEFDYIYDPDPITLKTSPVFPARFHPMLFHGMAVDDQILQLFDRSHSYAKENNDAFTHFLTDMRYWNAQLNQS